MYLVSRENLKKYYAEFIEKFRKYTKDPMELDLAAMAATQKLAYLTEGELVERLELPGIAKFYYSLIDYNFKLKNKMYHKSFVALVREKAKAVGIKSPINSNVLSKRTNDFIFEAHDIEKSTQPIPED